MRLLARSVAGPDRASQHFTRRQVCIGAAPLAVLLASPALASGLPLTPEQFGARGDGATNDTAAFAALAAHVNALGGGRIELRPVTYIVGRQLRGEHNGYSFDGAPVMNFEGCSAPLVIRGNGARLRCAAGLRYGSFDPLGRAIRGRASGGASGELATPYHAMVRVARCNALIEIADLELDGNLANLLIGGQYGDTGWQIPASGVHLLDNGGPEHLTRIHTHHHPLDGILIDGADRSRASRSTLEQLRSDHNGRQGCSITGGRGYDFRNCRFTDTGRSAISSAPGAGVDIEAEGGKKVRDLSFRHCLFANNSGSGMVADSGPSEAVRFDDCTFIGATSWAAWPNKPGFRFNGCTFVGPIVHAYGDTDPRLACQFHACSFVDDPALSPTGRIYGGENPSRPIADLPGNRNVLFDRCDFKLTHRAVLPWTTSVVVFSNCTMSQKAAAQSYPRGTFVGRNLISGNVDLYGSKVEGDLVVNGRHIPRSS